MNYDYTLARPYAKAIFELALAAGQLPEWSQVLQVLSQVAKDESVQRFYQNPNFSSFQLADLFFDVMTTTTLSNQEVRNFLSTLAYYRRLHTLPAIAELFDRARADFEKTLQVTMVSALPIKKAVGESLKKALEIRLQRSLSVDFIIDKKILGGAIIRAGDLVIDGSVRSKLDKLKQALVA